MFANNIGLNNTHTNATIAQTQFVYKLGGIYIKYESAILDIL